MSTAQELFDEAIEHYKKIIGYLDDVGEICKKYDLDYSASDLIRRFDIILQMTLLQTAVGDNDFDRLERVFIEEITSCGDVLDWINGECDTNFTWENVFYLSEKKLSRLFDLFYEKSRSLIETFFDDVVFVDAEENFDYSGSIVKRVKKICSLFTYIDGDGDNEDEDETMFDAIQRFFNEPIQQAKEALAKEDEETNNNSPVIDPANEKYYDELLAAGYGGDTHAQIKLGIHFMCGDIVEQDSFRSYYWFKEAAELGDAAGAYNLGTCYARGIGVDRDQEKAFEWYEKAAIYGSAISQYRVAICCFGGIGTSQNEEQGRFWLRQSAENGNVDAQLYIANCFFSGLDGFKQSYKDSYAWYTKAAEQDSGEAYYWLGTLLENGYVRTDLPENELWQTVESYYNSSIKLGCENGKDGLKSLKLRKSIKQSLFAARFEEENRAANEDTNQCYSGRSRADAYGSYNLSDEINEDDYESGDYEADSYEYDEDGFNRKE